MKTLKTSLIVYALILFLLPTVSAQEAGKKDSTASSAAELAKKLANPAASLISLPFQNNTDYGIGEHNGSRNTLNFQPVIPIPISSGLNMITRVIVPVISQKDITAEKENQFGLGDINATIFLSPSSKNGFTFAAGPVLLVPSATNTFLGTGKLSIGPSFLVVKQTSGFTLGMLLNQLWSVAGNADRGSINQMFIQPFVLHNWKSGAAVGLNGELTQNWEQSNFSGFLNATVSGVTKIGSQTIQLAIGPRIPLGGSLSPDFGIRGALTLVFPK